MEISSAVDPLVVSLVHPLVRKPVGYSRSKKANLPVKANFRMTPNKKLFLEGLPTLYKRSRQVPQADFLVATQVLQLSQLQEDYLEELQVRLTRRRRLVEWVRVRHQLRQEEGFLVRQMPIRPDYLEANSSNMVNLPPKVVVYLAHNLEHSSNSPSKTSHASAQTMVFWVSLNKLSSLTKA